MVFVVINMLLNILKQFLKICHLAYLQARKQCINLYSPKESNGHDGKETSQSNSGMLCYHYLSNLLNVCENWKPYLKQNLFSNIKTR